jgi:hypothetical protein
VEGLSLVWIHSGGAQIGDADSLYTMEDVESDFRKVDSFGKVLINELGGVSGA